MWVQNTEGRAALGTRLAQTAEALYALCEVREQAVAFVRRVLRPAEPEVKP